MDIAKLKETLIIDEGLKLKLYLDHLKIETIGVGRNLRHRGISEETAMQMLDEDIEIVQHELSQNLPFYDEMPEAVQLALCNLCFNMGISRLLQFKKTLQHLKNKEFGKASDELLDSRYATQLPNRSKRVADLIRSAE
tara:strand:+ start:255 stop:668 length:414 start_codon:yes stop_codon:yes gene_type:complete